MQEGRSLGSVKLSIDNISVAGNVVFEAKNFTGNITSFSFKSGGTVNVSYGAGFSNPQYALGAPDNSGSIRVEYDLAMNLLEATRNISRVADATDSADIRKLPPFTMVVTHYNSQGLGNLVQTFTGVIFPDLDANLELENVNDVTMNFLYKDLKNSYDSSK